MSTEGSARNLAVQNLTTWQSTGAAPDTAILVPPRGWRLAEARLGHRPASELGLEIHGKRGSWRPALLQQPSSVRADVPGLRQAARTGQGGED